MKALRGGKILTGRTWCEGKALLFDDRIRDIVPEGAVPSDVESVTEAEGAWVAPGFLDIHVHGVCGADTMDASSASLERIAEALTAHGVTAFCPTTMTMDEPHIDAALQAVHTAMTTPPRRGARVLGAHLEGPFLSRSRLGAQDGTFVRRPDPDFVRRRQQALRLVTFAPEEDEAWCFLDALREAEIVPSLGHSSATYELAMEAFRRGAKSATHLFNGMAPFHHRRPGLPGAALDADVTCELIADGVHTHPAVFRLVLAMKGKDRLVLVSDAMRGSCLGEGTWDLGGQTVTVHGEEATLPDGTIAGSLLTLDRALRNFAAETGLPLWEAVRLVSGNPARLLGEKDRGRIEPGCRADFVLLDESWRVRKTFVAGEEVFDDHARRDCTEL